MNKIISVFSMLVVMSCISASKEEAKMFNKSLGDSFSGYYSFCSKPNSCTLCASSPILWKIVLGRSVVVETTEKTL